MATIFFNQTISLSKEGLTVWSAMNGATRRSLRLICNLPTCDSTETISVEAQLGTVEEDNRSVIFLNPPKPGDDRVLGLFLNDTYGYSVVEGDELFSGTSTGGYGNSSSQFGIYKIGTMLKCHTYKNRRTPTFYRLGSDGWVKVENYFENTIKEI